MGVNSQKVLHTSVTTSVTVTSVTSGFPVVCVLSSWMVPDCNNHYICNCAATQCWYCFPCSHQQTGLVQGFKIQFYFSEVFFSFFCTVCTILYKESPPSKCFYYQCPGPLRGKCKKVRVGCCQRRSSGKPNAGRALLSSSTREVSGKTKILKIVRGTLWIKLPWSARPPASTTAWRR